MRAMLGLAVIATLLSVPAASGRVQSTYVDQGLLVSSYALQSGGAAVVVLSNDAMVQPRSTSRLFLVYVPGDGQPAYRDEEVLLSYPGLPDQIITDAQGPYVHITMNWVSGEETPAVHHYRWTLPYFDRVAAGGYAVNQVFLPLQQSP